MTTVIRLKQSINNADAPFFPQFDPIENRLGSLFLWDAGIQPFSSLPNIGNTIPNLLADYSNASGNNLVLEKGNLEQEFHDAYISRELTARKAIHFIVAQASTVPTYASLFNALSANANLQEKLRANAMGSNPNLYISVWKRITRVAPSGSDAPTFKYISSPSSLSDYVFYKQTGGINVNVSSSSTSISKLNKTESDTTALNSQNYYQMNIKGYAGAGVISNTKAMLHISGFDTPWGGQFLNKSASHAVYRIYIEDLNLSGRTFEQVKAIDDAEFEKAFAVGGRFYNDTWSDPASVLA